MYMFSMDATIVSLTTWYTSATTWLFKKYFWPMIGWIHRCGTHGYGGEAVFDCRTRSLDVDSCWYEFNHLTVPSRTQIFSVSVLSSFVCWLLTSSLMVSRRLLSLPSLSPNSGQLEETEKRACQSYVPFYQVSKSFPEALLSANVYLISLARNSHVASSSSKKDWDRGAESA